MNTIPRVESFQKQLDTSFTIKAEQITLLATLVKVNDKSQYHSTEEEPYEVFSLDFLVSSENQPILPQAIYDLSHPQLGEFSLFIVPVAQNEKGVHYEAVVNRRKN